MTFEKIEQFGKLKLREIPKQVNFLALKLDKTAVLVRLRKDDGAEDNQVVVDIEIGSGLILEQSL